MNHSNSVRRETARTLPIVLVAALLSALAVRGAESPVRPSRDQLRAQAERCQTILRTSLIDFYLPACVDTARGGYLESLTDGKFAPTGEKFLTYQARQLWFFSTLATDGYEREKALAAARVGFAFLQERMWDATNGGYFSKVTDAGALRDPRKHAYLNSFVLYGLAAYYRATGEPAALDAAKQLFRVLENKSHDPQHGGFVEFFSADWKPVTDQQEAGYVGAIGHKTYNTHLHLLESFAELYRVWPDDLLARRLHDLIQINTSTVRVPKAECNVDAFLPDWQVVDTPRNLRASYGHDVECAWLTLDAVRALGESPDTLRTWAKALCQTSIDLGFDRANGGFFSSGPLNQPADDTNKVWWVEAEALVSMLDMFRITGDPSYYSLFSRTLDFVEKFQVAKEGSWWATRDADGAATSDRQRTGPWQAGYHAGRSMIFCASRLNAMVSQSGSGLPR